MEGEPETEGWRVKLYELETQGAWIDKGTGYVICDYLPELSSPGLQIIGEESLESLLQCKIQATDTYERQGENIIMWRELDASGYVDYAMSFQESEGCLCIWDAIGKVQAQFLHQMGEGGPNGSLHEYVDAAGYHYAMVDPQDGQGGPFTPVLPVNCSNDDDLNQIKQKLDSLTVSTKDYVVSQLIHQDGEYIQRLFAKFTEMEERSFLPGLNTMADIFRSIFLLNDASLIGYLLCSDEIFVQVAGIFEYDKSLKSPPAYRHFLFTQAKLKEVVPFDGYFENPEELRSICVTVFRLKYVRDVMLHPTIDDPGVTALSSMIVFNSNEICSQMFHHILYVAKILEAIVPSSPKPVPETQTNPNPIPNTQISPNPHPEPQKTPNSPHSTEPLEGSVGGKGEEGVIKGEKERVKAGMRLDAVRLLKELFSLSRMLLVEKRNEIYELFFSHLRNQFVSVTTKLLSSNKHLNSEGVSTQPNTFWSKTIKTDRKKAKE